jgi:crotonobetainyl-CoA:carnitine CoA-transferase CaiB-like acyl-CoA transferase
MPAPLLAGIRVLDLSRLLPGPFCTWLLQSHGAEVVKVEEPAGGDYLRWVPPFQGPFGAMFTALHRGKRSVTLDLRASGGQRALRALLPRFDVVLESFRPGVLARFGLAFEDLHREFPRVVFASLTGFGQDGPWAQAPGHDLNFQGLAGLLAPAARPGGVPTLPALPVADLAGGALTAAFTITAALLDRERHGQGALLDLSMTDGALALLYPFLACATAAGAPPPPGGDLLTGGQPAYGIYRCADGRLLTVAALEPRFWTRLRALTGLEGAAPDRGEIAAVLATRPRDAWVEALGEACVAPLLELDELLDHPLVQARGRVARAPGGLLGAPPLGALRDAPPPALGQHSREELEAAGVGFDALLAEKISSSPRARS